MISYLNPIPTLSNYQGPYKVGSTEFEIPISEIDAQAAVSYPQITTIKFRVFYPTDSSSVSKYSIPWLPQPQKQYLAAYASFLGASSRWSSVISHLPSLINYTTIPAVTDAPLLPWKNSSKYPLAIFSHGLGSNCNTYSAICGELASCGVICVAPEHRDGSSPISNVRSAYGNIATTISYQKHSHAPTPKVLNARNSQLRVRLWELDLLYSAVRKLNAGENLPNYAAVESKRDSPLLKDALDLSPGKVTWAGHSFGAACIVQFVKAVYYHQQLPSLENSLHENDPDWKPVFQPTETSKVIEQIIPSSPIALLDLWTMPLRCESTNWLWEKPLPCYERPKSKSEPTNTISIMSTEFYKWKDLVNRTRALLSARPAKAMAKFEQSKHTSPDLAIATSMISPPIYKLPPPTTCPPSSTDSSTSQSRTPSPHSTISVSETPASSTTSLGTTISSISPKIFLIPSSAHLSQSDFGVLFPNLTRYFMNAVDPGEVLELNIRAILAVMRGAGLGVRSLQGMEEHDQILCGNAQVKRWVEVPLVD